jgi:hypothetical protein
LFHARFDMGGRGFVRQIGSGVGEKSEKKVLSDLT